MPKQIVIVAADFPPSNNVGTHRSRLFANHLAKFGYEPTVLSVDPEYYEGTLDHELTKTVSPEVKIVRTKAFPTRPVRLVGDIGIRSLWQQYRRLCQLAREQKIDLIYIPIPPNFSALLGPLVKWRTGVPYVIDYIDPWIYQLSAAEKRSWKALVSFSLAYLLEPFVVRQAVGISGVANGYFEGVIRRNPSLASLPTLGIPYGCELLDARLVERSKRASTTLERVGKKGKKILVYAGALMPHAHDTFRTLLAGARLLKDSDPGHYETLQFIFVGVGPTPLKEMAGQLGVEDVVTVVPERQPYLEILAMLRHSHAALIMGSNEPHYTASKTFQLLSSQRPILGMLHEASSAAGILKRTAGAELVTFRETALTKKEEAHRALRAILSLSPTQNFDRTALLEEFSAETMTSKLAAFFDRILAPVGVVQ